MAEVVREGVIGSALFQRTSGPRLRVVVLAVVALLNSNRVFRYGRLLCSFYILGGTVYIASPYVLYLFFEVYS